LPVRKDSANGELARLDQQHRRIAGYRECDLLQSPGDIILQTYGFGGGRNVAGTVIPLGRFDPFLGLFQGLGPTATFINGTSDILTNDSPGCPPAELVTVSAVAGQCGDVRL
jgi:hypothetical protein